MEPLLSGWQRTLFAHRSDSPVWPDGRVERRAEFLRPRQFAALLDECPILYIPLGTLEWHGQHLPLGTDSLKAHHMLLQIANLVGGMVYPPLYLGIDTYRTSRSDNQRYLAGMDAEAGMQLPGSVYRVRDETYSRLVLEMAEEALRAGFRLVVLLTGHNAPNQESVIRQVAETINARLGRHAVLATNDWEQVKPTYRWAQDHAGKWETSLMMVIAPNLVEMDELPPLDQPVIGIGATDPRTEATPDAGHAGLDLFVEKLVERLRNITESWSQAGAQAEAAVPIVRGR